MSPTLWFFVNTNTVRSVKQVPSSVEKIMEIDEHLGCATSGLTSDARTLVEHARVECQNHRFTYNEAFPIESCTQSICDLSLKFGEDGDEDAGGMVRREEEEEKKRRKKKGQTRLICLHF